MQLFRLTLLLTLFTLSAFAQTIRPVDLSGTQQGLIDVSNNPITTSGGGSNTLGKEVLRYYDTSTPTIQWRCPGIAGPFIIYYFAQRFTCPGTGAFIDTIAARIDESSGGEVRLRIYDATTTTLADGRKFWIPNFNVGLGDTIVPAGEFGAGQLTKIPVNHTTGGSWQVPKHFFLTVEVTADASGNANELVFVTDTKKRTWRDPDSSRSIMVVLAGSNLVGAMMDSVFLHQGEVIYPNLYAEVYISTTDPSGPVITSTPPTTAQVGKLYTYQLAASGNPPPSFSIVRAPSGMSIVQVTGQLLWQPKADQVGTHTVIIRATNNKGTFDQSFDIVVTPGPGAPKITSTPVLTGQEGVPYSYKVTATGTPSPTFSLVKKPIGMTITPSTGQITWTPNPNQIGNDSVTVRALNTDGIDDQSFVIVVTGQTIPPTFSTTPIAEAIAGQLYSYDAHANGKPVPTYRLKKGPAAMTLDSIKGVLNWTPARADKGPQQITLQAVNVAGTSEQNFSVDVLTQPIITSATPLAAEVGVQYSFRVTCDAYPNVRFRLAKAPAAMTIDTLTGDVRWMPQQSDVGKVFISISAINKAGSANRSDTITVTSSVGVPPLAAARVAALNPNFPNPFSTATSISVTLHRTIDADISIVDALGRTVRTQRLGERPAGTYAIPFDAAGLSSGVYFVRLKAGAQTFTRPMQIAR